MRMNFLGHASFVGMVTVLLLGTTHTAFAANTVDISTMVSSVLPGSVVTMQSAGAQSSTPTQGMLVQLSPSAIPSGLTTLEQEFAYEDIGWRVRLVASIANETNPYLTSFSVLPTTGTVPINAQDALHGGIVVGSQPFNNPSLDSVGPSAALSQLQSNLTALKNALPTGSVLSESAVVLPLGSSVNQFALQANVTVDQPSSVAGHYGDVIEGLQTGLIGGPFTSMIEGLEIEVTAADGTPVVGAWESTRSASGTLQFGDPTQATSSMQVTTSFPVLTGGPTTASGALGSPGGRSSSNSTSHVGNAIELRSTASNASIIGSWWILGLPIVAFLVFLSRRKFRIRRH